MGGCFFLIVAPGLIGSGFNETGAYSGCWSDGLLGEELWQSDEVVGDGEKVEDGGGFVQPSDTRSVQVKRQLEDALDEDARVTD